MFVYLCIIIVFQSIRHVIPTAIYFTNITCPSATNMVAIMKKKRSNKKLTVPLSENCSLLISTFVRGSLYFVEQGRFNEVTCKKGANESPLH